MNIEILDYEAFQIRQKQEEELKNQHDSGDYEVWQKLDEKLIKTVSNYGKVGADDDSAFYTTGDWFHQYGDALVIFSSKVITKELLLEIQSVAKNHHEDTCIYLPCEDIYETEASIEGLEIFISSRVILVAWDEQKKDFCERQLKKLNIRL